MRPRISILLFSAFVLCSQAAQSIGEPSQTAPAESPKADPFDFGGAASKTEPQPYVETDEKIKLRVEPIIRSAVVDRVVERSTTIYVNAPGSVRVEVYLEPVDSPYCGKSLAEPKLIGQSRDGMHGFPVAWNNPEPYKYVKIYAMAFKRDGQTSSRSRSVDLSLGGARLQAQKTAPPRT